MRQILYLIAAALIVAMLFSCSTLRPTYRCTPSKGSRDYAKRQWMHERSDGYFVVTTQHGLNKPVKKIFECKPDSIQLANL